MIIRSLHAENILKYRTLRLNELPEQGVIAVSGDNESGKSAIGEIICFALFGRTYSLVAEDLRKLVRWGSIRGQVTMRFATKEGEREIIRTLDRGGAQSARLVQCDRPEEPLERGLDAVNETIERSLGFDFDEYVETFYLAQREITAPHPHSRAVKAMAGIEPLERCAVEFRRQTKVEEEARHRLEGSIAELEGGMASLGPERLRVDEMERGLEKMSTRAQELEERIDKLGSAADDYCAAHSGLRGLARRRRLAGLSRVMLFVSALVCVGVWALLRFEPRLWPLPKVREHLQNFLAATGMPQEAMLIYGIIAILGLFLLALLWSFALSLGMTTGFLVICMLVVRWIFKTGYRLRT